MDIFILEQFKTPDFVSQFQNNFIEAKSFICKRETIEITQKFLSKLNVLGDDAYENKYITKTFLLAFIIYYYPKDTLDDQFVTIYFLAKSIVISYINLIKQTSNADDLLNRLRGYIMLYMEKYKEWQKHDREFMINELLIQYFDLENTLNELDKTTPNGAIIEKQLTGSKETILKRLDILKSKNLVGRWKTISQRDNFTLRELIYSLKSKYMTGFEYYGDPVEIIGKKAYWDYVADDLKINKKFDTVYGVLSHFKQKLKELIPNKKNLWEHYDDNIDTEFIEQLVDKNLFGFKNIEKLITFMLEQVKSLDSENGSKQIDQWIKNWDCIKLCHFDLDEVLPYILRDIINKVERLVGITNLMRSQMLPSS
jgi:hypothetical protein